MLDIVLSKEMGRKYERACFNVKYHRKLYSDNQEINFSLQSYSLSCLKRERERREGDKGQGECNAKIRQERGVQEDTNKVKR